MLKAADIFKDSPSNREVFLSFSSDRALNASAWRHTSSPAHRAPAVRHPPTSSPNSTREPHIQHDSDPQEEGEERVWKNEPMQQNTRLLLDAPPPADLSMSTTTKPLDCAAANTVAGGGAKQP